MKRTSLFLIAFLIVMLFLPLYQIQKVQSKEEPYYELSVSVDEMFYLHGETAKVTVQSNASTTVTLNVFDPSQMLIYTWHKTTNSSGFAVYNLPISETLPYGTYSFKVNITEYIATTWATVLDVSGWTQTSFPYQKAWMEINYTIKAKGFVAEGFDSSLNITLPYFDWYTALTVKVYENGMCLLQRITHEPSGLKVDLTYAFIHCGLKIIINGSIPEPTQFTFKFVSPKTIKKHLDSLKTGHLIFDWSDIRKAKQAFSYNKTSHKLTVTIPSSFRIDPVIFEDGFEDGYNPWTATSGSPAINQTIVHHGSNSSKCVTSDDNHYCYKDHSAMPDSYTRFYVYIESYNLGSTSFVMFSIDRDVGTSYFFLGVRGTTANLYIRYYDGGAVYDESSTNLSLSTWYCLEMEYHAGSGDASYRIYLDGVNITDLAHDGCTSTYEKTRTQIGNVWGSGSRTITSFFDCVVMDNEYIGPEEEVGEYTEEFTNTISISASLSLWKALSYTETETVTITSTSYAWGEYPSFFTETTTTTEQHNQWNELRRFFTESITPTEQMNTYRALFRLFQEAISPTETSSFTMELALLIMEFTETIRPDISLLLWDEKQFFVYETITLTASLQALVEEFISFIEFSELIQFDATMYLTLPTEAVEYATKGFVLATIILLAFIGLPLLFILWRRKK